MANRARSIFLSLVGSCTQADAEGSHAHGLNERIRVKSLMNGRRFLYEVVKLHANGGE